MIAPKEENFLIKNSLTFHKKKNVFLPNLHIYDKNDIYNVIFLYLYFRTGLSIFTEKRIKIYLK